LARTQYTFSTIGHGFFIGSALRHDCCRQKRHGRICPYCSFLHTRSHIMNLDLQNAHAYMDAIQDASNRWLIDGFQDDDDLRLSCSGLRSKCKLLQNRLDFFLGDGVEDGSDDGSDSEEVRQSLRFLFLLLTPIRNPIMKVHLLRHIGKQTIASNSLWTTLIKVKYFPRNSLSSSRKNRREVVAKLKI
jgi:hypothetical protein